MLACPLLSFSSCFKMKIQAVVALTTVVILTTLVAECELFQPGTRELREKVWTETIAYQAIPFGLLKRRIFQKVYFHVKSHC